MEFAGFPEKPCTLEQALSSVRIGQLTSQGPEALEGESDFASSAFSPW